MPLPKSVNVNDYECEIARDYYNRLQISAEYGTFEIIYRCYNGKEDTDAHIELELTGKQEEDITKQIKAQLGV